MSPAAVGPRERQLQGEKGYWLVKGRRRHDLPRRLNAMIDRAVKRLVQAKAMKQSLSQRPSSAAQEDFEAYW
jgi:HJR/Mrr/RecB family endonuclease